MIPSPLRRFCNRSGARREAATANQRLSSPFCRSTARRCFLLEGRRIYINEAESAQSAYLRGRPVRPSARPSNCRRHPTRESHHQACAVTIRKSSAREPGDLDVASPPMVDGRQPREGDEPQAAIQIVEESDEGIVPRTSAKTWVTPVESGEGRPEAQGQSAARDA